MEIVLLSDVAELDNNDFENDDKLDRAKQGMVENEPSKVLYVVLTDTATNPY